MSMSDYLEAAVAAWINGTAMPTAPTGRYISLHIGDPTDTGTGGTDCTTTIRVAGRVAATFTRSGGVLTSSADVDFGAAAGAVTGLSHFAVWDAASAGNCLGIGAITGGAVNVSAGTNVKFLSGQLTYTLD